MATTYEYRVRDRAGKLVKGRLDADSPAAVVGRLKTMGYAPIRVDEVRATGLNKEIHLPLGAKVTLKDLALMSRQFATMISAGLSLLRALHVLAEQTENKELGRVLTLARTDVESGASLSSSLAKHPAFPPLVVNMVRAGEVGGFLDTVLLQVAANLEAEVRLRGRIKSAMTYPVVVLVFAILAVIGMLLFIVPIFEQMFTEAGAQLPLPTRVLVALSGAMRYLAPLGAVVGVVGFLTWGKVRRDDRVRDVLDPLKLNAPVLGPLFRKVAISRFSRNLGTMISAGVPILQSLDIVAGTTGNVVLERGVRDVQESVRRGESLAQPLAGHGVFPPMVVQMMAVGEDTGALDVMLQKIGDFYDQEVEATTESLTALIEPLMIAVLGGVIGSMIIALYLPIFGLMNVVQ